MILQVRIYWGYIYRYTSHKIWVQIICETFLWETTVFDRSIRVFIICRKAMFHGFHGDVGWAEVNLGRINIHRGCTTGCQVVLTHSH